MPSAPSTSPPPARRLAGALPLAAPAAFGALVVLDAASPFGAATAVGAAAAWAFWSYARLGARRREGGGRPWLDLELAWLALVGVGAALVRGEGGFDGVAQGALFLAVALSALLSEPAVALGTTAGLLGLEGALRAALGQGSAGALAWHGALALAFVGVQRLFLGAEVGRLREEAGRRLEDDRRRLHDDARDYRLLGPERPGAEATSAEGEGEGEGERRLRAGVEEIHEAVLFGLGLARHALGAQTLMLLWLNEAGTHLRVAGASSEVEGLLEGPFGARDGLYGAAMAEGALVTLGPLSATARLPHYAGAGAAGSVCLTPVRDGGEVRGLVVADRREARPFDAREQAMLAEAARHAARVIRNERLFLQLEREKAEQGRLYRAAEALGVAAGEDEVLAAAVKAARDVARPDFAAITVYDAKSGGHEVRAALGEGGAAAGARFGANGGLVDAAVRSGQALPYRGETEGRSHVVFDPALPAPPGASVLVVPLALREGALGTLVVGARRRGAFGDAVRPALEALARHVAVSLADARNVRKLEELATTDGLTGLLNKRALLEAAGSKLAAAARFGRPLSVVVADIDHFKKVNDVHGHDVGDLVIKGLGAVFARVKRSTDSVARFGGEEFVALCEQTDGPGALLLAERIREELKRTSFSTPAGPLSVTCSVGVATFPAAGRDWDALFKAADEALYVSKRGGRDRSTLWTPRSRAA
jgi:two-component system cell cycle response regulator